MRIRFGIGALALAAAALLVSPAAHAEDAWLGVSLQDIDEALREALDVDGREGVLVSDVDPDSPADEAGLREGDVILEIDARAATSARRVVRAIERAEPGDEMAIVVWRDGERITLRATLDEREDDPRVRPHRRGRGFFHVPEVPPLPEVAPLTAYFGRPRLGVETRRLDEHLAPYFGVEPGEGVLVLEVMPDTPAEEAGLHTGDVILRVDGEGVDSPGDLRDLLLDFEGETVTLEVKRRQETLTIEAELDDAPRGWRELGRGRPSVLAIPGGEREALRDELEALREDLRLLREEMEALKRENASR